MVAAKLRSAVQPSALSITHETNGVASPKERTELRPSQKTMSHDSVLFREQRAERLVTRGSVLFGEQRPGH